MNKRGGLFDIFIVLIVMFIVLVFFAAFIYGFGLLSTTVIDQTAGLNAPGNVTQAAQDVFGTINASLPALQWVAFVIVIAMVLGIMVSNFLVKAHPAFFIVYILLTLIAVVFSATLSNAYQSILVTSNPIVSNLQDFTAMNYMMLHLPFFTTIVGFAGAIFLFLGITVDRQAGGGVA